MMQEALKLAAEAFTKGEVPVGALIINPDSQEIVASAYNLTEINHDPTAHAEILAIRMACKQLKTPRLEGLDIYVTLEPCAMCAAALSYARIRRIYFGAFDNKMGAVENGARIFHHQTGIYKPEIYGGIMEQYCKELMQDFFKRLR